MTWEDIFYIEKKIEKSQRWVPMTLAVSSWDLNDKSYSFETPYPSTTYDITDIIPSESATETQRIAWAEADCGGYYAGNEIVCHGILPNVDIPVMLCIKKKTIM